MAYLKFLNSQHLIRAVVTPESNVVTLRFYNDVIVNTSGFHLYLDENGEVDIGGESYLKYNTIYRNDEITAAYNGYQLSNDGSVYVPPEPEPEPEPVPPYIPTLEEIKETKVREMNLVQQEAIQAGVNVALADGTVEHFTLTDHDQTSLMSRQNRVEAGDEAIPWHTSDEAEHCKFYSNADMAMITSKAMEYVTWHVTYFRDLRIYIRSLESAEAVEAIFYGVEIPDAFQSVPLRAMIEARAS